MLDVHLAGSDWTLPSDATRLSDFHITLIGRKLFLHSSETMASAWKSVRASLPAPPQPELETTVLLQSDENRRTWFLPIINQTAFQTYIQEISTQLDNAFRRSGAGAFLNTETSRYFHISIANNQGGDPLKSIGGIRSPSSF